VSSHHVNGLLSNGMGTVPLGPEKFGPKKIILGPGMSTSCRLAAAGAGRGDAQAAAARIAYDAPLEDDVEVSSAAGDRGALGSASEAEAGETGGRPTPFDSVRLDTTAPDPNIPL
jgi:hypothetical protein